MIAGSRLALVTDDRQLAGALQRPLKTVISQAAPVCSFDTFHPQGESLLLLAAASTEAARSCEELVQELSLLKGPPILLIHAGAASRCQELAGLVPYVAGRLHWPTDSAGLAAWVQKWLGTSRNIPVDDDSLEKIVARRLLSQTPSLFPHAQHLALAAAHDVTVLFTGETGTGKTFLARLIHDHSSRAPHRFLVVPCGALAASLLESELFGHVKGAFTGADRPKPGKFAAVGEGTLLLEEIDTLALEQQATLLRVIETGEYEPVGSNETQRCMARIIVASNSNLEEAVGREQFRRDLFYRLNVMSFHLPPLRERAEDIEPLTRTMVARFNKKFRKGLFEISEEVLFALKAFPWPGNIRQLENVIQQAVLVSRGPKLLLEHLPRPLQEHLSRSQSPRRSLADTLLQSCEMFERISIQRALVKSGYSRARAATALGVSRVTLYKKMKKYGLMDVPIQLATEQPLAE